MLRAGVITGSFWLSLLVSTDSGCYAFCPTALPSVGLRGSARLACSGSKIRNVAAKGVVGLKSVLGKESHAPTAMDWEQLGSKPWGSIETDNMYISECAADGQWTYGKILKYGNIEISPRAGVLNYGQGIFEGMKAQRSADGRIALFRPDKNARRVRYGCVRNCMPPVPEEIFVQAIKDTVLANAKWVPPCGKGSLYIRPIVVGTGPILGLAPAPSYTFAVYVSPVGSYFKGSQMTPIKLKIEDKFSRAAPGGTGGTKSIGNYAGSLLPQVQTFSAHTAQPWT
jgi:branched-chain amino acid aminotransferase